MAVATAVAVTLAWCGLIALVMIRAPRFGLRKHPRVSLVVAILGAVVAGSVVVILIGAPVVFGMARPEWWPATVTNYYLAMAHRMIDGPYPFFWTPAWMYIVGSLTPLIAVGAVVALAAGISARKYARRTAAVIVVAASCLLVAYAVAGIYAAAGTWAGIPL